MLTLFLLLPVAGALLAIALPTAREAEAKIIALAFTALDLAVAVVMYVVLDRGVEGYQFVDRFEWIQGADAGFSVQYAVGVDGLSAPLVVLLGLLSMVSVLISWKIDVKPKQ